MSKIAAPSRTNMTHHFLLLSLCWSLFMIMTMAYEMQQTKQNTLEMARLQAKVARAKDRVYRNWVVAKGGVYAPINKYTPPNPYLDVDNRDLVTTTGLELTLINPAYMFRQVHDREKKMKGVLTHVTSHKLVRPENAPDAWELAALAAFHEGEGEIYALEEMNGESYMRFMSPVFIKKGCLKCHGFQDYKIGDLRGGISISVPMIELKMLEKKRLIQSFVIHCGLWILGVLGLFIGTRRLGKQLAKRRAVEESLQEFKVTLDQTHDCVFLCNPDTHHFFYVNQGPVHSLGYGEKELLNKGLADISDLSEQEVKDMVAPLLNGDKSELSFETFFLSAQGERKPVDVRLQYIVPDSGHGRMVIISRDISKRKAAEAEKEKMQVRLLQAQKLESVGQLAAGIAHEINTPIQYVGGNIDFFAESFHDLEEYMAEVAQLLAETENNEALAPRLATLRQGLEEIDWEFLQNEIPQAINQSREGVQQISKIVLAMKEFSHPGTKEKSPNNINKIIENTVTIASNEWKYVAEMEMDLDPNMPLVPCLSEEIGQVILNMVVNAAHAIKDKVEDEEKGKGKISIKSRHDSKWAGVTIKDSGNGIQPEIISKIFDPFFTTKEVGSGSGQGLAIAHDVVTKHGGEIKVKSDVGEGTTFFIKFPLVQEKNDDE